MLLAYVAHSERCALLLDADGICRWFVMKSEDESVAATAKRCVGAQYVATLDPDAEGLLGADPCVGKSVLFARVDEGRVTLVRFGPLVQFDTLDDAATEQPSPVVVAPEPALAETSLVEPARLTLVPTAPMSEPTTLPSAVAVAVAIAGAVRPDDEDRETQQDLFDEDDLATAAGEHRAYRPLGSVIRAQAAIDADSIETSAFTRALVVRASRRGMLPRRG